MKSGHPRLLSYLTSQTTNILSMNLVTFDTLTLRVDIVVLIPKLFVDVISDVVL